MLPSRIRDCIRFKWIHERFHLRKYENYYLYAWLCKRERESERGGGGREEAETDQISSELSSNRRLFSCDR